jgi:Common central domain of tyrosinase
MIPLRRNVHEFSSAQNQQYAGLHSGFVATTGAVADHLAWHSAHGPGTDEHFLVWHRYFVRWLEDYLGSQGMDAESPIPYWPSDTPIPPELTAGTVNANPNVTPPTWTTMAGGTDVAPVFGYTALGQFKTTAELGRAIGTSYHGTVHQTVGGTMATFSSPLAPIFYPWHSYIDHIWAQWQRRTMAQPTAIVRGNTGSPDAANVRINLFVRRKDGNLWERYWDGATWTWSDTGKAVFGRAVALVRGDVEDVAADDIRINLFVQGTDRRLWERYWDGAAWTWVDAGKEVDGEPLVLARGNVGSPGAADLRVNLFVRGLDGNLWERYWDGAAWTWVDTGKAVSGDPIAVVRGDAGDVAADDLRINLFVRGADGNLWERYWDGAAWTWVDTGKAVSHDPVALIRGSSGSPDAAGVRINLFVRGADGHLWERYWDGAAWTWVDTGKGVRGRVTAILRGNQRSAGGGDVRINLFAEGTDGQLWERYWDGATWTWVDTGKPAVGEPLAIVRGNTGTVDPAAVRINLFVPVLHTTASGGPTPHRHFDIHLWERYWNGAAWAWVDTGLDIRNKPAAISRGHVGDVATDDLRINLWVAGNDAKLWERYWDGASWSWVDTGAEVSV